MDALPLSKFERKVVRKTLCPFIPLPDNWDEYLKTHLSKVTRKKLNRRTEQIHELPGFHVTHVDQDNFARLTDILLGLWKNRWDNDSIHIYRNIFKHCLNEGNLWLAVSWTGDTPLAALACFIDSSTKTMYSFMSAFNEEYSKWSPGAVMDGYSIQYAIERISHLRLFKGRQRL